MNCSIQSLEKIESKGLISSPMKAPPKSAMKSISEEEEKLEMTVAPNKLPLMQKPEKKEFESADCLALQLFKLKNNEEEEDEK